MPVMPSSSFFNQGGVSAPPSPATMASGMFALNTTTGNQTFTLTDLNGVTPKAAIFVVSTATTTETYSTSSSILGTGITDGTTSFAGYGDIKGTNRHQSTSYVILGTVGASEFAASFVSFQANSITVNITTAPSSAYKVMVILFAGNSLSAKVNYVSGISTGGTAVSVGFEPEIVFGMTDCRIVGLDTAYGTFSLGIAHNGVSVSQHGFVQTNYGGFYTKYTSNVLAQLNGTTFDYTISLGTFSASGFIATASAAAAASDDYGFLSLSWGGTASISVGTVDSPTATGNDSITGIGFQPTNVMYLLNNSVTPGTATAGSRSGIAYFDATNGASSVSQATQSASVFSESNIYTLQSTVPPTLYCSASFVSMDADGWTLNYSTAPASSYIWPYLAIKF